jgi:hypothetical protein
MVPFTNLAASLTFWQPLELSGPRYPLTILKRLMINVFEIYFFSPQGNAICFHLRFYYLHFEYEISYSHILYDKLLYKLWSGQFLI